jgi:hypothetical protein
MQKWPPYVRGAFSTKRAVYVRLDCGYSIQVVHTFRCQILVPRIVFSIVIPISLLQSQKSVFVRKPQRGLAATKGQRLLSTDGHR